MKNKNIKNAIVKEINDIQNEIKEIDLAIKAEENKFSIKQSVQNDENTAHLKKLAKKKDRYEILSKWIGDIGFAASILIMGISAILFGAILGLIFFSICLGLTGILSMAIKSKNKKLNFEYMQASDFILGDTNEINSHIKCLEAKKSVKENKLNELINIKNKLVLPSKNLAKKTTKTCQEVLHSEETMENENNITNN